MKGFYLKLPILIITIIYSQNTYSQSRIIINGGFEPPNTTNLPANSYSLLLDANYSSPEVEGWKTTASTSKIEVWSNNYRSFSTSQGSQFAELNSTEAARLYQDVCLSSGETLSWEYYHRGRTSASISDVSELNLYNSTGTSKIIVLESASDDKSAWGFYSGSKTLTIPSGMYQFSFEAISTANGDLTTGNFLDGIQIKLVPFVEFTLSSQTGQENLGNNLPKIRINGQVPTGGSIVTLSITGGTATKNVDYTLTSTMTIPAGYYPPSTTIDIPLTIIDDVLLEGNETIQLRIISATNTMLITDANCDGTNGRNTVYTISDNEALPVEFLSFNIQSKDKSVVLKWNTANESNNKKFIVERSENGFDFDSIGSTRPTSLKINPYLYEDKNPLNKLTYYRIKQVDFDGGYQYSSVQMINSRNQFTFYTYPNPFSGQLNIVGLDGFAQIKLLDAYGKSIIEMPSVDISQPMDFAMVSGGVYVLKIIQNGTIQTSTVFKID